MAIIGIVAVARNNAIGKNGKLPWHYSADMKFFKRTTTGNACLMGYNTWKDFTKPLPRRLNIVLSRRAQLPPQDGVITLHDSREALNLNAHLNCDLFIIGGAQVYQAFMPHIERWIVTEIPLDAMDADTFMPDDFLDSFSVRQTEKLEENLTVKFYEREL